VIREVERAKDKIRNRRFLCLCAKCGEEKIKYLSNLEQGKGCMCSVDWQLSTRSGRAAIIAARHVRAQVSELGRICLTCNTWKPWEEFKNCGVGRQRYMGKDSNCKACNAEKRLARIYRLTRDELLWLYKIQDHVCALCGQDGTFYRGESLNGKHSALPGLAGALSRACVIWRHAGCTGGACFVIMDVLILGRGRV